MVFSKERILRQIDHLVRFAVGPNGDAFLEKVREKEKGNEMFSFLFPKGPYYTDFLERLQRARRSSVNTSSMALSTSARRSSVNTSSMALSTSAPRTVASTDSPALVSSTLINKQSSMLPPALSQHRQQNFRVEEGSYGHTLNINIKHQNVHGFRRDAAANNGISPSLSNSNTGNFNPFSKYEAMHQKSNTDGNEDEDMIKTRRDLKNIIKKIKEERRKKAEEERKAEEKSSMNTISLLSSGKETNSSVLVAATAPAAAAATTGHPTTITNSKQNPPTGHPSTISNFKQKNLDDTNSSIRKRRRSDSRNSRSPSHRITTARQIAGNRGERIRHTEEDGKQESAEYGSDLAHRRRYTEDETDRRTRRRDNRNHSNRTETGGRYTESWGNKNDYDQQRGYDDRSSRRRDYDRRTEGRKVEYQDRRITRDRAFEEEKNGNRRRRRSPDRYGRDGRGTFGSRVDYASRRKYSAAAAAAAAAANSSSIPPSNDDAKAENIELRDNKKMVKSTGSEFKGVETGKYTHKNITEDLDCNQRQQGNYLSKTGDASILGDISKRSKSNRELNRGHTGVHHHQQQQQQQQKHIGIDMQSDFFQRNTNQQSQQQNENMVSDLSQHDTSDIVDKLNSNIIVKDSDQSSMDVDKDFDGYNEEPDDVSVSKKKKKKSKKKDKKKSNRKPSHQQQKEAKIAIAIKVKKALKSHQDVSKDAYKSIAKKATKKFYERWMKYALISKSGKIHDVTVFFTSKERSYLKQLVEKYVMHATEK
eukprot:jgi/Bigna1/132222/aug1.17_g6930